MLFINNIIFYKSYKYLSIVIIEIDYCRLYYTCRLYVSRLHYFESRVNIIM